MNNTCSIHIPHISNKCSNMSVSSALMAIAHILFFYILFFSFQASNGARVVEESNSNARPSTCSSGPARGGLKVVHRYGPCSRFSQKKSSASASASTSSQIFLQDQRRVQAINSMSRQKESASSNDDKVDMRQVVGGGMYETTVGLGTPETELDLILDTGSYITWVRCNNNSTNSSHQQPANKYYVPSSSSTWSTNALCSGGSCDYTQRYLDHSFVSGSFMLDTITLDKPSQVIIPNFDFLCAQETSGDFGDAGGLLGLGRPGSSDEFGQYSLMSQSKTMFNQVFCHCLPTIDAESLQAGYVYFGKEALAKCHNSATHYTPLLPNPSYYPSYYRVHLIAITIGTKRLNISSAASSPSSRTIIDSGTAVSRLPSSVYSKLTSEFKMLMMMRNHTTTVAPAVDKLDTCYYLQGKARKVAIPNMILHFRNLDVKLDRRSLLWKGDQPQVCLAFAKKDHENDVTIIGSHQLQKLNVLYDLKGGKLGISPGDC